MAEDYTRARQVRTKEQPMATPQPIVLNLSAENGGPLTFKDAQEFLQWLVAEIAKFDWLRSSIVSSPGPANEQWANDLNDLQERIRQPFQTAIQTIRASQNNLEQVKVAATNLLTWQQRSQLVVSASARYKFVEQLLERQRPVHAAYALRFFFRTQTPIPPHKEAFEGSLEAALFELGLYDKPAASSQARFDELLAKWKMQVEGLQQQVAAASKALLENKTHFESEIGKVHSECSKQIDEGRKREEQIRGDASALIAAQKTEFDAAKASMKKDVHDAMESVKTELDQFKKNIYDQNALDAPVKYWLQKAMDHGWYRCGWLVAAVVSVAVAIGLVAAALAFTWNQKFGQEWAKELWMQVVLHVGPTILASFIGIWLIRFSVRNYLSEKHLASDASLRATMVRCYLALGQRTKLDPRDPGMRIALEALFRPVQFGLIPDEQMPEAPHAWLQKVMDSQK
jgi:hypothetical protein